MEYEISYIWPLSEYEYKEHRLYWHLLCRGHELKNWEHTEKMKSISVADIFLDLFTNFEQFCENRRSVFMTWRTLKSGSEWALYLLEDIFLTNLFGIFSILW